ncbi:hypothetical protein JYQ62_27040 [Nostoc sp. UHCC 0702]|nr:hypothetical protein JYQ62_27040 [Nostoc sp. UHCC 0702]
MERQSNYVSCQRDWGLGIGDWGLGTGDWGLGTGDWGGAAKKVGWLRCRVTQQCEDFVGLGFASPNLHQF